MKSKQQKRTEAAARLERYAERIASGERGGYAPEERAAQADRRRAEAKRLRTL